jgi:hypothetical protein
MSLLVTCSCGQSFRAQPELAGKQVPCPVCGTALRIPAPRPRVSSGAKTPSPTVTCQCGRSFRAKPELAGKQVACPACGVPLRIPMPGAAMASAVADDPLGLGDIDLANLGPPLPGPATSSLLSSPARAPVRRRTKQDWRAIRVALMVGGGIAGALVGVIALLLIAPLVMQLFNLRYGSPEAVFAAATQAAEREDWRSFCGCLTPPSRDALASSMIHNVSHIATARSFASASGIGAGQAVDAKIQPILDVLQRHRLDDETVKRMASELPWMPTTSDVAKMDQALAPIRDRNGFIADMIAALRQVDNRPGPTPFAAQSELTEVKIDGDRATGMVVSTDSGLGGKQSIAFQRSGGGWKIHAFNR